MRRWLSIHNEASQAIGDSSLLYHAVGHDYRVSGGSFFQTNRFLIDKLVEIVDRRAERDAAPSTSTLAQDCSPRNWLATSIRCLAVESSPHSFADLRHNVPSNVKCIRSTTEKFPCRTRRQARARSGGRRSAARGTGREGCQSVGSYVRLACDVRLM